MQEILRINGREVCDIDQLWMISAVTVDHYRVQAIQIELPFSVETRDRKLEGEPGDWLLRDANGWVTVCPAKDSPPIEEWFSEYGEG